jgi:hypothetical protein
MHEKTDGIFEMFKPLPEFALVLSRRLGAMTPEQLVMLDKGITSKTQKALLTLLPELQLIVLYRYIDGSRDITRNGMPIYRKRFRFYKRTNSCGRPSRPTISKVMRNVFAQSEN